MHGDLSEYNILYHNSEVYFIDVSQSVEHDHPASFDFLREWNSLSPSPLPDPCADVAPLARQCIHLDPTGDNVCRQRLREHHKFLLQERCSCCNDFARIV